MVEIFSEYGIDSYPLMPNGAEMRLSATTERALYTIMNLCRKIPQKDRTGLFNDGIEESHRIDAATLILDGFPR